MKAWNFQVSSDPKEISRKLDSSLGSTNRFVFKANSGKKDLVKFRIRKRMLLAFEINTQNNLIVNGKIFKVNPENKSDVEISFALHPLSKLLLYGHIILGLGFLAAVILKFSTNSYMFILGGILLAIGIIGWLHLQRVFDKQIQEYKTLISEILELRLPKPD